MLAPNYRNKMRLNNFSLYIRASNLKYLCGDPHFIFRQMIGEIEGVRFSIKYTPPSVT